jgi:hypothetical protein
MFKLINIEKVKYVCEERTYDRENNVACET